MSFFQTESRVPLSKRVQANGKERARKYFQRRYGDGEAETYEFGVAQPVERRGERARLLGFIWRTRRARWNFDLKLNSFN